MTAEVIVAPDHDSLAAAVAARTITALIDALSQREVAHLCLTGGTIGIDALAAIAHAPARAAVPWHRVHVWWSDERFLPTGDPERNETGARAQFLDVVAIPASNVHPMPAPGWPWNDDVDQAAAAYADELDRFQDVGISPEFDVLMLGVGPDGHVASLFPGQPALADPHSVCGVTNSPKPPPVRISFTMPTINRARQVWLIASGLGKAHALALALGPEGASEVPAGAVRGTERTLALLDADAASELP
jgi:6-phosphogluconolactonase